MAFKITRSGPLELFGTTDRKESEGWEMELSTKPYWQDSDNFEIFWEGESCGLRSKNNKILLPARFDHIELCVDFIHANQKERQIFYYKNGVNEVLYDDEDYKFYENGHVGLRNAYGSMLIPAEYDEIIDWGDECDVIYLRRGKEFKYINHNLEEILWSVDEIPEDAYPLCPYSIGEDQDKEVLLCAEPVTEFVNDGKTCFAFRQWCHMERIPKKDVETIFSDFEILPFPKDKLSDFYSHYTYIYSARYVKRNGENALMNCIKAIEDMWCYDSSWNYLIKVAVNHNTKISPVDLFNFCCHYEDLDEAYSKGFGITYDDSLEDGEVSLFQIHYHSEGPYRDEFRDYVLSHACLDEVIAGCNEHEDKQRMLDIAFWHVDYSASRDWDTTSSVLNYLLSIGCADIEDVIRHNSDINPFYIEEISSEEWQFKKNSIEWAINNGAQLNHIYQGETVLDSAVKSIKSAKEFNKDKPLPLESIRQGEEFIEFLKSKGAISSRDQRLKIHSMLKDDMSPSEVIHLIKTV